MRILRTRSPITAAGPFTAALALLLLLAAGFAPPTQAQNVNLYTGDSTYTVPIVTPPGTNGVGPKLALVYGSSGGNDWIGTGWGLTGLGSIERLGPTYSPSPTYTSSDTYRLNLGGSHKLVYAGTDPSGAAGNYYRTQIESFARIDYVSASNYWVVTDTGGTKYFFGLVDATRQTNPGDPTRVFRWQLEKVLDPHLTFATVSYNKDATNGDMYPSQIVYTQQASGLACTASALTSCRVVDFFYETRPDRLTSYRTGAKIVSDQRLQRIEMKQGGQLVKKYTLAYTMSATPARGYASVSQLTSVTETGADGTTSPPATTFTYNVDANGSSLALTQTPPMTGGPAEGLGGTLQNPPTPSNCTYTVDVNRDGLPDILVGKAPADGGWKYYPNLGSNNFGPAVTIPNPGTAFPSLCNVSSEFRRHVVYSPHNPAFSYFGGGGNPLPIGERLEEIVRPVHDSGVIDLDGDGLPDILHSSGVGQWYWWRNLGDGLFADRASFGQGPSSIQFNDPNVRVVDMDADGLLDLIQIVRKWYDCAPNYPSAWEIKIFRNLGRDQSGTLQFTPSPFITELVTNARDPDGVDANWCNAGYPQSPNSIAFADMNGDGLPDFVWPAVAANFTHRVHYYPNLGRQNSVNWSFGSDVAISHFSGGGISMLANPDGINFLQRLTDVNGDGLADVMVGSRDGYFYHPLRADSTWGDRVDLSNSPPVDLLRSNFLELADMNGDGFPDVLYGSPGNYWYYALNNSDNHQLLETARTPLGGTQTLAYWRLRDGGTIRWVMNWTYTDDGLGQTSPMTHIFSGAKYVGWPQNEFRGYASATVYEPDWVGFTQTYFHQDDAKKGRVNYVEARDIPAYDLFAKTTYSYATSTPVAGVSRVDLTAQVMDTHDGQFTFKTARTDYANFDNYGQARQATTSGTDITPRVTTTDFVYNTYAYILNRPSRTDTRITSATGTKIGESWFNYDGLVNGVAPTKGDLTKQLSWLSGGTNRVVQNFYDAYGNRTGAIDAKSNTCAGTGRTVKTDYDTTYQTFPVTVTNALCQQATSTYWGINTSLSAGSVSGAYATPGFVATVTDPNGVRTDSYWDALGRPMARVVPPDTAAAPTTVWGYTLTGAAPSFTIESKREATGGGTLATVTHVDGLGRPVQVKGEAEAAGQWTTQDTYYNPRGLVERVSVPYLTTASSYTTRDTTKPKTTTLYDPVRRPVRVTNPDNTYRTTAYNQWVVTQTDEKGFATVRTSDALGRLLSVQEPAGAGAGGTTTYSYDSFATFSGGGLNAGDNIQSIADATGLNTTSLIFDTLGRKTFHIDPDLGTWSYSYDANGNLLTQTDAKLQTLSFSYDRLNRIAVKTYPDAKQVAWSYDNPAAGAYGIGRLRYVTDLSGDTTFAYDQRGRPVWVGKRVGFQDLATNPGFETGTTWPDNWSKYQQSGSTVTFTWDDATKRSGAKSVSIANATSGAVLVNTKVAYNSAKTYTATGWIKTQNLSAANAKVKFDFYNSSGAYIGEKASTGIGGTTDWTQASVTAAPGSAPAGTASIAVTVTASAVTGTAWFDDVTLEDGAVTVASYSTLYGYDSLDRVTTMTYPDFESVQHTYNAQGLLDKLRSTTYSLDYVANLDYNPLGKVTAKTAGNGKVTSYDYYDTTAEGPLNFRLRNLSTPGLQNLTYSYDNAGNITGLTDTVKAATQTFGYDTLHRLNSASSTAAPTYIHSYVYNAIGNVTYGAGKTFTYPAAGAARPHAPTSDGTCSYGYDANGNLATRTCGAVIRSFTWDYDNRLSQVKDGTTVLSTFTYDHAGQRVKKVEGAAATVIPFPHYRTVNGAATKYYFANGERVAERDSANAVFYYHADHLGSSNTVSNSAGAEVKATLFYPYGSTRSESGTKTLAHKYTGQEQDASTGLYNYGARYYDPAFMHFVSADNIIPDAGDPQMLNRYSYVRNNPIRLKDPTGYAPRPSSCQMPGCDEDMAGYSGYSMAPGSIFSIRARALQAGAAAMGIVAISVPAIYLSAGAGLAAGDAGAAFAARFSVSKAAQAWVKMGVGGAASGPMTGVGIQLMTTGTLRGDYLLFDAVGGAALQESVLLGKAFAGLFTSAKEKAWAQIMVSAVFGGAIVEGRTLMQDDATDDYATWVAAATRFPAAAAVGLFGGWAVATPARSLVTGAGLRIFNTAMIYSVGGGVSGNSGSGNSGSGGSCNFAGCTDWDGNSGGGNSGGGNGGGCNHAGCTGWDGNSGGGFD